MIRIHPSLLSADPLHLGDALGAVSAADGIHLDLMDGHFVPTFTFGPWLAAAVCQASQLPVEAHLMVSNPERHLEALAGGGVGQLIVHQETTAHLHRLVAEIHRLGARAGVAVNPATPVETLVDLMAELDLVLVMSVDPGWGGQAFWPGAVAKVRRLRQMGFSGDIELDGGMDETSAPKVVAAGATILVAGSYIFAKDDLPARRLKALRSAADGAPAGRS